MERQQVFYIHGGEPFTSDQAFCESLQSKEMQDPYGIEVKRWHQTLRDVLGEEYEVFTPQMPNKQNAKYEEWKIWFERHLAFLSDGVVFVGWSLGGMFLMKYFAENSVDFQAKALFCLSAPFVDGSLRADHGKTSEPFGTDVSLLDNVKLVFQNITIMHSTDDSVVPYEHALKYKSALPEAELVTFTDKDHFLVEELPELVERIKRLS